MLQGRASDHIHGLSAIDVTDTGRLTAIGDLGIVLAARLVLDRSERLVGLTDAHVAPLLGEAGEPLINREEADAEGLAVLSSGDRLVSFERRARIWSYPDLSGRPRPVPFPEVAFPSNGGMEALAADPENGSDAYMVGAEISGETWTCRVSTTCVRGPSVDLPAGFGLVAMRRLPGERTAYLLRAYDQARGTRISLQIVRAGSLIARMDMAPPMAVDNYEGLAAVSRADGSARLYLISDDNASGQQRTLLMAFDWRPTRPS